MTVSVAERLDHILDAIAQVKASTAPLAFEEFAQDRLLRWGVERGLEIISEATRSIPSDLKNAHSHISWRRIADFGNRLRHAYHDVDSLIVWKILTDNLDELQKAVTQIKSGLGEES